MPGLDTAASSPDATVGSLLDLLEACTPICKMEIWHWLKGLRRSQRQPDVRHRTNAMQLWGGPCASEEPGHWAEELWRKTRWLLSSRKCELLCSHPGKNTLQSLGQPEVPLKRRENDGHEAAAGGFREMRGATQLGLWPPFRHPHAVQPTMHLTRAGLSSCTWSVACRDTREQRSQALPSTTCGVT